jgi:hypothetical protein
MGDQTETIKDWGNELYSGLGGLGIFKADLIVLISIAVIVVLVLVGFGTIATDDSNKYENVQGIIVDPNCEKTSVSYDNKGYPIDNYKCHIMVTYQFAGKVYTNKIYQEGTSKYIKNEPVELLVTKNDPNTVQFATMNKTTKGCLFLSAAVLVGLLAYINYYLTYKYKVFAAAQGASSVFGLFR